MLVSVRGQKPKHRSAIGEHRPLSPAFGVGLTAPWVVDNPLNRATFGIYVETLVSPTLKPGDVVILDNLASHKSDLKERGAWFLFLPP